MRITESEKSAVATDRCHMTTNTNSPPDKVPELNRNIKQITQTLFWRSCALAPFGSYCHHR
jgi:hypothetical protein